MKRILLSIIALLLCIPAFSQCEDCMYKEGVLWVVLEEQSSIVKNEKIALKSNSELIKTMKKFKTNKFIPVFPHSKNEYLQRVYKIEFKGNTDYFRDELETKHKKDFKNVIKRPKDIDLSTYDPTDYMWYLTTTDTTRWLWHLNKIKADLAWDITTGDTSVHVAILDTWFDINHPDLTNKISPHFDPYDTTLYSSACTRNHHGTTVASFVAAETNGGGQLASVGFDCNLICYQAWDGDYLERAHHASLVMGADVVTSSAGGWRCESRTGWTTMSASDTIEMLAVQEILNNGTIIVMPAGNGVTGTHCRTGTDTIDAPWFPLHPHYDDRIIIVSSTDVNDNHTYINSSGDTIIHSFYPEVDICAPGYGIMGATSTERDTCSSGTCCVTNSWPYYGSCTGTSFATPIVAGVCALTPIFTGRLTHHNLFLN